jgi:serine/threonine protein kinase
MRRILFIALCLLAAGLFQTVAAQTSVPIDEGRQEYPLGPHLAVLEDPDRNLTFDKVAAPEFADRFKPVKGATPSFGYSQSAFWFRFTISSNLTQPRDWVLDIAYPALDNVEFYSPVTGPAGPSFSVQRSGDAMPFQQREVKHRNHVFRIVVPPKSQNTYYIRMVTTGTAQLPATLLTADQFQSNDYTSQFLLGLYYGILLVMAAYNLFIFLVTQDRSYLFYVLYILSFGLGVFSLDGLAFQFFWPNSVWWANRVMPFVTGATALSLALFVKSFLSTADRNPRTNVLLSIGAVWGVANMGGTLFLPEMIASRLTGLLILFGSLLAVTIGIISLMSGFRPARFFLLAMTALFVGTTVFALQAGGTIPSMSLTRHGLAIGSTFEVVLLSLGLADRINALRREKNSALAEAKLKEKDAEILRIRGVELAGALNETERKNQELARANAEIERKNLELDKKIIEIETAQRQADRMFLALADALPGTVIEGKYLLGDKIGAGGFGVVFRGRNVIEGTPIAVKVFRPIAGNDSAEAAERFRREGLTLCRVHHPNAVQVFDSGISSEGIAYIVMELLVGTSLSDELHQSGRLSLKRAAEILRPVCEALAAAHAAGIIHRDIKPDNVFLHHGDFGEVVKVVDFGIAKLIKDDTGETKDGYEALTKTGGVIGTPQYIAPERLCGNTYNGQSDVYSVGVMLYQMLCGQVPFHVSSNNLIRLVMSHLNDPPPPMRQLNPSIPPAVEAIVLGALAKNPAERPKIRDLGETFANAAEVFGDPEESDTRNIPGAALIHPDSFEVETMGRPIQMNGAFSLPSVDEHAPTISVNPGSSIPPHPATHPDDEGPTILVSLSDEVVTNSGSPHPDEPR